MTSGTSVLVFLKTQIHWVSLFGFPLVLHKDGSLRVNKIWPFGCLLTAFLWWVGAALVNYQCYLVRIFAYSNNIKLHHVHQKK